jgi:hypothetical protein
MKLACFSLTLIALITFFFMTIGFNFYAQFDTFVISKRWTKMLLVENGSTGDPTLNTKPLLSCHSRHSSYVLSSQILEQIGLEEKRRG